MERHDNRMNSSGSDHVSNELISCPHFYHCHILIDNHFQLSVDTDFEHAIIEFEAN